MWNPEPMGLVHWGYILAAFTSFVLCATAGEEKVLIRFRSKYGSATETREYNMSCAIFRVSRRLRMDIESLRRVEPGWRRVCEGLQIELEHKPRIFDIAVRLLDRQPLDTKISAEDIDGALSLAEHLEVSGSDEKAAFYRHLAEATTGDEDFRKGVEKHKNTPGTKMYMLQMLREYANMYNIEVRVEGDRATLCPLNWHPKQKYGSTDRVATVSEMKILGDVVNKIGLLERSCSLSWFMDAVDIHKLDVSECNLDDSVVRCIGEMRSITKLDMHSCGAGQVCLEHLSREQVKSLVEIDVSRNKLCESDLSRIGKMRSLVKLNVSGCEIGPGRLSEHLQRLENLTVLRALENRLNKNDLASIGRMRGLETLEIGFLCAEPGCISRLLQELGSLQEMKISCRTLNKDDLSRLGSLRSLVRLDMRNFEMEPGSIQHLQESESLRELCVSCAKLGKDDLSVIGKIKSLTKLRIHKMERGSLKFLQESPNLGELSDSHDILCEDGLSEAIEMGDIGANADHCGRAQECPGHTRGLDGLHVLDVSHNDLNKDDIAEVGRLKGLAVLDMSYCNIKPGSLRGLKGMESLRSLNVSHNDLNKDDIAEVGRLKGLAVLDMSYCNIKPGSLRGLREPGSCKEPFNLRALPHRAWRSMWGDTECRSSEPNEGHQLEHDPADLDITEEGSCKNSLRSVEDKVLESLRVLNVSWNKLGRDDLAEIARLESLTVLYINDCSIKTGSLKNLRGLENLRDLNVSWNKLSRDDLAEIGDMKMLERLYMSYCEIKTGSLVHLLGLKRLGELGAFDFPMRSSLENRSVVRELQSRGVFVRC